MARGVSMERDHLPLIDLRDHLEGTPVQRRRAAGEVSDACSRLGFLLLRGHGLDHGLMDRMRAVSAAFFDAPAEYKEAHHRSGTSRGYTPMGTERLGATAGDAEDAVPDVKEAFAVGAVDLPDGGAELAEIAEIGVQPVTWPRHPPSFRRTWLAYYSASRLLAAQVMDMFADALDIAPSHFSSRLDRSADFLRVINYPHQSTPPAPRALRAGVHTDFGALTLLATDDAPGGLQVRRRDGGWVDVPHVPGTFVVNVGDLMEHWTNHRWVSAVHRVVNPPANAGGRTRRQSIVFFCNPNLDAVIEALPSCLTPGERPPPPVTAGEWLRSKTLRQRIGPRSP
jgi:isopenicillin N synthase-like dioxygenase